MRDPTRGGLATTLNDFAGQSNAGMMIEEDKIPVDRAVLAACDLLGLDPLYIANEGKLVAIVPANEAAAVMRRMKRNKYGKNAVIIGEVVAEHPRRVVMKTLLGASRIVDMPVGELLPRIC